MAESGNIHKTYGALTVNNTSNLNSIRLTGKSSITQGSTLNTAVTLDSPAGFISTLNTSGALLTTLGSASFTVNNVCVKSDSIVLSNIVNFGGAGVPNIRVGSITDGSFSITLTNVDWINPLTGSIKIAFSIL